MYRFHHVCLSVTNRERSVKFYELLGFKQVHLWEADDNNLSITHLRLGGMMLELFCYADYHPAPGSIHETSTDLPVIGTKHFGLRVDSIEAARADLVEKGIAPEDVQIKQGRTGPRIFFISDPDGILVEIAEDNREFWNT
jgi:glyoxylase I family protein